MLCHHPSPQLCHTPPADTHAIADLDAGKLPEWTSKPVPPIAIAYWRLGEKATMRDLLLAIRADEAIHRDVNHTLAVLPEGVTNPFV